MESSIVKTGRLNRDALSGEHYYVSLVEQGRTTGLITDSQVDDLQYGCLAILSKMVNIYNRGGSSSIRSATAQELLKSLLYTAGVSLKMFDDPNDALAALITEPFEKLYNDGIELIGKQLNSAKLLHARLSRELFDTPNEFYRSTIIDGIVGFFKLYRPEFAAHEIHITADYPTYHTMDDIAGIEFIKRYLNYLYYENSFLKRFSPEYVHRLLCSYGKDYPELLFNLFEPVLCSALGCALLERNVRALSLSSADVACLTLLFEDDDSKITESLLSAVNKLSHQLTLSGSLTQYIKSGIGKLVMEIKCALTSGSLDRVFLVGRQPEQPQQVNYSFGGKMDDEQFRAVVNEIMLCRNSDSVLSVVKENVNSLMDFEDILLDAELSRDSVFALLDELTPAELAVFCKKYPKLPESELNAMRTNEAQFVRRFNEYLSSLPPDRREWITRTAEALRITN